MQKISWAIFIEVPPKAELVNRIYAYVYTAGLYWIASGFRVWLVVNTWVNVILQLSLNPNWKSAVSWWDDEEDEDGYQESSCWSWTTGHQSDSGTSKSSK